MGDKTAEKMVVDAKADSKAGSSSSSKAADSKDPPPPYSFAAPPGELQPPQAQPQGRPAKIPRQFPPAFNMYRDGGLGGRHYTLGEHQDRPLYAVALHTGFSGKPDVVLHNGPSDSRPPLAAAEKSGWSSRGTVYLPPVPGLSLGTGPGNGGIPAAQEKFETGGGPFGHKTFSFGIETGVGEGQRREMFEWRHSSSGAVKGLGGRGAGWKLCRLANGPPAGVQAAEFVQGGERGSDGREVVAVWAWASGSMTKTWKFQFLGSGANGVLGERWAVMAVMTALKMWDIERRARQNARANAGAAGGGA
ncbi:uncharacterized protein F4807DRAFT_423183 [Annulohypoxylon truncatum]|uniref:uncharacterized protein n=1 Tax=Annulohypoxylon truncatum TaxID=327061 RepID=UPI00200791FE|nr:uncharacterized protein F4807DRAFT_423183 [Annulohypoxylon truncatum]KAI1210380.1 hypothetical protein F4807DRAFT_423183 [Annulohypoxylon truncatum]